MTDEKALQWLRDYHGSIDSTALLLAFKAGYEEAVERAAQALDKYAEEWIGARDRRDGYELTASTALAAIRVGAERIRALSGEVKG